MAAGAGTKQAVFRLAPYPSLCSQNTPCLIPLSPSNTGCLNGPGGIPGSSLSATLSPFILTPSPTARHYLGYDPVSFRMVFLWLWLLAVTVTCYCETCNHKLNPNLIMWPILRFLIFMPTNISNQFLHSWTQTDQIVTYSDLETLKRNKLQCVTEVVCIISLHF